MADFKYQHLQRELEQNIHAGVYGVKLPSVRSYAKQKQVSISTVQKAYEALERNGLISAEAKKGYFLCQPSDILKANYGKDYQRVSSKDAQEKQVLLSLNDDSLLPLSSTAPSSVLNNAPLLSKLHKKAFDGSIYQYHIEDEVQGNADLRQTISLYLSRQNNLINPNDIHIVAGRKEALLAGLVAANSLGNTVAVEAPTSFYFQSAITRLCNNIIEIPIQKNYDEEIKLLDKAYLEHRFTCYLVNPSFHDPTGRLLTETQKLALLEWAEKRQVTLIEYDRSELHFGAMKPKSLAHLANSFNNVSLISIQDFFDTVSTRVCLGFVICKNISEAFAQAKHTVTEDPNLHTQNLINELIHTGQYETRLLLLQQTLQQNYLKTQEIFQQNLPKHAKFESIHGGPCIWLYTPEKSSTEIWQQLIKQNVAIAPGSLFGNNEEFHHYFRFTFALPWNSKLALSMHKICQAVK